MTDEQRFELLDRKMKIFSGKAMNYVETADKILSSDNPDRMKAVVSLKHALSLLQSAQVIYLTKIEYLEHDDIECFFEQFDVFVQTALTVDTSNYIAFAHKEYEKLKEKFDYSVLSQ